jgi:hypothetical protein
MRRFAGASTIMSIADAGTNQPRVRPRDCAASPALATMILVGLPGILLSRDPFPRFLSFREAAHAPRFYARRMPMRDPGE